MKKFITAILVPCLFGFGCTKRPPVGPTEGFPGSRARFALTADHLYLINGQNLDVFALSPSGNPVLKKTTPIDFISLDTIYALGNRILLGNSAKIFMFDITTPDNPELTGEADFLRSCKKLGIVGNAGYVTTRVATDCYGFNGLQVYDFSAGVNPLSGQVFEITGKYYRNIAQYDRHVYIAGQGLDIYDVSNPLSPELKHTIQTHQFSDLHIYNDHLLGIVNGGILVYDLQNPEDPQLVSTFYN